MKWDSNLSNSINSIFIELGEDNLYFFFLKFSLIFYLICIFLYQILHNKGDTILVSQKYFLFELK